MLLLPLLLASVTLASSVDVSQSTIATLLEPGSIPTAVEPTPPPYVVERQVVVDVDGDRPQITATWRVEAWEPGWFTAVMASKPMDLDHITANGQAVAVEASNASHTVMVWVDDVLELRVQGSVPLSQTNNSFVLPLMPAPRGNIQVLGVPANRVLSAVDIDGVTVPPVDGGLWSGSRNVTVAMTEPRVADKGPVATAKVGVGLTVFDAEIVGKARVEWRLLRGTVTSVSARLTNVGSDLTVSGPGIASWNRSGSVLQIELVGPAESTVVADLNWTQPLSLGDEVSVPVPTLVPNGVVRASATLEVARDGDREVVPALPGWTSAHGEWRQGLVTAGDARVWRAGRADAGGSLNLIRFTPVSGPPTIVDIAAYTAATSRDGRMLVRGLLQVRNDRGAWLRMRAPAGLKPIGLMVEGEPAIPVADGDAWLIPLTRSVETVDGLLSFPVEVFLLGENGDWNDKTDRKIALPTFDAEVAISRLTLHLPPGFDNQLEAGEHDVVDDFTEGKGLTYGFAVGDHRAAQADQLFQEAVAAWMDNDFQEGQGLLDQLEGIGAANENIDRLQSNFNIMLLADDKDEAKNDDASSYVQKKRVVEQAAARADQSIARLSELSTEAAAYEIQGDETEIQERLEEALELLEEIEQVRDNAYIDEDMGEVYGGLVDSKKAEVEVRLRESRRRSSEKERLQDEERTRLTVEEARQAEVAFYRQETSKQGQAAEGRMGAPDDGDGRWQIHFDDIVIEGSITKPEMAEFESLDRETLDALRALGYTSSTTGGPGAGSRLVIVGNDEIVVNGLYGGEMGTTYGAGAGVSGVSAAGQVVVAGAGMPEPEPTPEPSVDYAIDSDDIDYDYGSSAEYETPGVVLMQGAKRGGVKPKQQRSSGRSFGMGMKKMAPATMAPPAPLPPPPPVVTSRGPQAAADMAPMEEKPRMAADEPMEPGSAEVNEFNKPLDVTASSVSVIVPSQGEAVLYQHLLLPPGEPLEVVVQAKRNRRDR